jgi:hypothetical protein
MTAPRVFVGIPSIDSRIHLAGMFSINNMTFLMAAKGWHTRFDFSVSSDICQSRAFLAMRFMESDCTHMLMIDSDLDFDPEATIRLIESGHALCGGAYPKKVQDISPQFTSETIGPSVNGFRKTNYLGGGLMMVRRHVLEKIKHKFPELTARDRNGVEFTSYFQNGIIDGFYRSEDAALCYRWQQCGGTVWVIEDCRFVHFGSFGWGGNLKDMIAKREETQEAA